MRALPAALLFLSTAAGAQTGTWLPSASGEGVSLASSHIVLDSDLLVGEQYTSLSNATVLMARVGGAGRLRFVADVPVVYAAVEGVLDEFGSGSVALGNPYLGVETTLGEAAVGFGVRVPLVETLIRYDENDAFLALAYGSSALGDRVGAFAIEAATVVASVAAQYVVAEGFTARGRLIPQVLVPVAEGDDVRAFVGYDLGVDVLAGPAVLSIGARGLGSATEPPRGASRFDHFVGASVEVEAGGFRPGAYIEVPVLGDFRQAANAVVGIGVSTAL